MQFGAKTSFGKTQSDREDGVTKALEKTYDGIIIGAGHHGLILGSYLAKAGLAHSAGRPPPGVRRRLDDQRGHRARASITTSTPSIISTFPRRRGSRIWASKTASPTSPRATSSARRIATARRWCSAATAKRPSPMSRASRRKTPRRFATGTGAPRKSPRAS